MREKINKYRRKNGLTNSVMFWNILTIIILYTVPFIWGLECVLVVHVVMSIIGLIVALDFTVDDGPSNKTVRYFWLYTNSGGLMILFMSLGIMLVKFLVGIVSIPISCFNDLLNGKAKIKRERRRRKKAKKAKKLARKNRKKAEKINTI